ncbi:unnamed protein product [Clonostachys rosea]|uniref:Major facilitator superfamily (MFS) profile domain-containing protein n=1 Tax=Bionectria ochroleuca TaxID=29856 RepID=A0ABY6UVH3_BIOOC|nr:unnamed protein product [Clonostachys rosea]
MFWYEKPRFYSHRLVRCPVVFLGNALLDDSSTYAYLNYAASDFEQFSLLATLSTAATIVNAVSQLPLSKISDVLERWIAIAFCLVCQTVAFVLMAASSSLSMYAAGYLVYSFGLTGLNILGQIVVADLTSSRVRALAIACFYIPSIFAPWAASFMIDAVIGTIGWRWGVGIFAIFYPGVKLSVRRFCSEIDLGGNLLLCAAFTMILLPITLAGTGDQTFDTMYLRVLLTLGVCSFIGLLAYEYWCVNYPVLPFRYFRNLTIVAVLAMAFCDYLAHFATHTYLFSWALVARNFSPREANFLNLTNLVAQVVIGIPAGLLVYKLKKYKWVLIAGAAIRIVGYGVMLRLGGAKNPVAELYIAQVVQDIGSGILESLMVVAVQVAVPHSELAQATSVFSLFRFTGAAVGSAVAGGIYNNLYSTKLAQYLGPDVDKAMIGMLVESIAASVLPDWGSPERLAAMRAYSDATRYLVIAAVAASVPILLLSVILPNPALV